MPHPCLFGQQHICPYEKYRQLKKGEEVREVAQVGAGAQGTAEVGVGEQGGDTGTAGKRKAARRGSQG